MEFFWLITGLLQTNSLMYLKKKKCKYTPKMHHLAFPIEIRNCWHHTQDDCKASSGRLTTILNTHIH